jgi:NADH-quinone oxidoreductase subunit N
LMVESNDLIMLFLAIEFLSITSYVLVGYLKTSRRSTEASVKYFLFGSICSALMLYGMSLLYALTGSTNFERIQQYLPTASLGATSALLVLVVVTFFAGIGFKISMWPFHMWAPDAYEGAPTPVTAFLAVGPKLAGIAVFVRVVQTMLRPDPHWAIILGITAMITMTWGNLAALGQTNIKRLLAYSSIAQAGYLLVGIVALSVAPGSGGPQGGSFGSPALLDYAMQYAAPAVLVYSAAYLIMNLGAFIVAIEVERLTGTSSIEGFAGLAEQNTGLAAAMTVFLLGLGGIPLTAGFIGKLYLFGSAVAGAAYSGNPMLWALAGFGVANSVVSIFYYFRVVQPMWMSPPAGSQQQSPVDIRILAGALAFLTIGLGIFGQGLIKPARQYQSLYGVQEIPAAAADAGVIETPTTP